MDGGWILGKKGQITAILIVGIVIVLGSSLVLFSKSKAQQPQLRIEEAPTASDPISGLVQSCLATTTTKGLKLIGLQGGYAYPDERGIAPGAHPTEGNAILFPDDTGWPIASWWYLSSPDDCATDCQFSSERPGMDVVAEELERYIVRELRQCLNVAVVPEWDITYGDPIPAAQFVGDGVSVQLSMPVTAQRSGERLELSRFYATLPTMLSRMYALATELTNWEANNSFLELHTQNLIGTYSGGALPPISDVSFSLDQGRYWIAQNARATLQDALQSYVPGIRLEDAANFRPVVTANPVAQGFYDQMVFSRSGLSTPHQDIASHFSYLGWQPYFSLNSGQQVIGPESSNVLMGILSLAIKRYAASYDLSYPVVVRLSSGGEELLFALEVNIRQNEPLSPGALILPQGQRQSSTMFSPQGAKANVTVVAVDDVGQPVSATVGFASGREFGIIGETARYPVVLAFPAGAAGRAVFTAQQHLTVSVPLAISGVHDEKVLQVVMPKLRTPSVRVEKVWRQKINSAWVYNGTRQALADDESVNIILERVGAQGEEQLITHAAVTGQGSAFLSQGIAPGHYRMRLTLTKTSELYIPPTRICPPDLIGGLLAGCTTVPNVTIQNESVIGGTVFDERPVTLHASSLDEHSTIVLTVLETGIFALNESFRRIDDLKELSPSEELSIAYRTALLPRFE